MTSTTDVHPSDLFGFSRLAIDATAGLADLVEAMQHAIAGAPGMPDRPAQGPTGGTAGLVYETVRAVTRLVGGETDAILAPLIAMQGERHSAPEREAVLAALNGVMGDYLAATDNPLAISMRLRRDGQPLTLERQALAAAIPQRSSKLIVLVHGLCMNDLQWTRNGHNHGAALAGELGCTTVHLHYNSGLHVSANGRTFADLIEALVEQWPAPCPELAIIAHSVGGLVSRSAYHYGTMAGQRWPQHLRRLVFPAPWFGVGARRSLDEYPLGPEPLQCASRSIGQNPQRRHHRPALRQSARRRLARDRSFRAFGRPPAPRTATERRTLLHDCRDHSEKGRQPQSRVSRRRPGAPQQRIGPSSGSRTELVVCQIPAVL